MSIKENIINKLLDDENTVDFEQNISFINEIKDDPEAIKILLVLLQSSSAERQNRIYGMLVNFSKTSLPEIASALSLGGSLWRHRILEVMWGIINVTDEAQWEEVFHSVKVRVLELLSDREWIPQQLEDPIEIEYRLRVCDDAYLFCQSLLDHEYDESDFLDMDEELRNREIETLKSRINNNILIS